MNHVCERFININLVGNIIPLRWYQAVRNESGKTDAVAVSVLADIVYWYIPVEVRDEKTGAVTGYAQKFKTEKLQRSYKDYSDLFGFSENRIKAAIENLVRQELITCELSSVSDDGIFLEPVFETIMKITISGDSGISSPSFSENPQNIDSSQAEEIFIDEEDDIRKEEKIVKKRLLWKDFEHSWGIHLRLQGALRKMDSDELEALKAEYRGMIQEYPNLLQIFDIEDMNHTKFLFFCHSEKGIMPLPDQK